MWGPSFRPEFLAIREVVAHLGRPPILALTATATPEVRNDIVQRLGMDLDHNRRLIVRSFDRPNLRFVVRRVPSRRAKDQALVQLINQLGPTDSAIVYVARRRDAERLAWLLETHCRIATRAYHAGLSASLRASIQEAFLEQGAEQLRVIVATKAFGMGIDKPDVRVVIHYNLPDSIESYYQEAGRAGRDEAPADCILLYQPRDGGIHEFFIRQSAAEISVVKEVYRRLLGEGAGGRRRGRVPAVTRRGNQLYVDPVALATEADVSETTVRLILYHLEKRGVLARKRFDYGTPARLKLRRPPNAVRTILEAASTLSEDERAIVSGVIDHLGFVGADEREFETRDLADALGCSPVALEGALLKAARLSGLPLFYRSWERGLVLALDENAPPADTFTEDLFATQRERARARLGAMHHYARTTGCRRRFLLEYLGDSYTAPNCGACDRCAAALVWPWPDGAAALPTLTGGVDTAWEIIASLACLAEPPTYKQFLTALRGQERYGAGGRHSLRRDLLAADWFGRLQYVPAGRVEAAGT